MSAERAPWLIAVPVRRSRFHALSPEHEHLNIEVDLGAIAPFDFATSDASRDDVLYSDLQTTAGANYGLILGSGRSGFYRGTYLKGVGRTLLAGNWDQPGQAYHASGHLMASGAVRELVVSRYLAAKGFGHTIVPCQGILLGPRDPRLARFDDVVFPGLEAPAIDRHLQALSVKPAGFARASNLLWLLEHCGARGFVASFFRWLAIGLAPDDPDAGGDDMDPTAIAAALVRAIDRALGHFEIYLRAGVFWGSFHNNLTLDGRFLDLECAMIFGKPFLGQLELTGDASYATGGAPRIPVGCEVLSYLLEMRRTLEHLRRRWRFLLDEGIVGHPLERDFVEEVFTALDDELPPDHPVRGNAQALDATAAMLERVLGTPPARRQDLRSVVDGLSGQALRPVALSLARSESVRRYRAFEADFLPPVDRDEAQWINRRLDAIDAESSVEGVASTLSSLLTEIG